MSGIDFDKVAEVVFVLSPEIEAGSWKGVPKNKLRFALPAVCRQVKRFIPLIEKLLGQGYRKWEIGNCWGLAALPDRGIDLSFDSPLYMLNSQAIARGAASRRFKNNAFGGGLFGELAEAGGKFAAAGSAAGLSGRAVVYQCSVYPF